MKKIIIDSKTSKLLKNVGRILLVSALTFLIGYFIYVGILASS